MASSFYVIHNVTLAGHIQQIARKRNSADNSVNENKINLKLHGAVARLRYLVAEFYPTHTANQDMAMLKYQMI